MTKIHDERVYNKEKEDKEMQRQIALKMQNLPRGFSPSNLIEAMQQQKTSTLAERTIDDLLKVLSDRSSLNRMTVLNDERLDMFYKATLADRYFYKRFARRYKNKYSDFIDELKELLISTDAYGHEVIRDIAATQRRNARVV